MYVFVLDLLNMSFVVESLFSLNFFSFSSFEFLGVFKLRMDESCFNRGWKVFVVGDKFVVLIEVLVICCEYMFLILIV